MTEDLKKKIVNLQHDGHNSIDRIDNQLYALDKWCSEVYSPNTKHLKLKDSARPYVVAEYLRNHIKDMRVVLNELYNLSKEINQ